MIYAERPTDGGAYGWCPKCNGFVIALGRHCFNDDSHIVDHLSPQEREELKEDEILESPWKSDPSLKKPPEPIEAEKKPIPEQKSQGQINGEKIKKYRERFAVGREQFERTLGLTYCTIRRWEEGFYPPESQSQKTRMDVYSKLMGIIEKEERFPNPLHDWKEAWETKPLLSKPIIDKPVPLNKIKPEPEKTKIEISFDSVMRSLIRNVVQEETSDLLGKIKALENRVAEIESKPKSEDVKKELAHLSSMFERSVNAICKRI